VADLISRASRGSIWSKAFGKRTFYDQIGLPQDQAYERAIAAMAEGVVAPDGQEGIDAFLHKRPPAWWASKSEV
jgi:enoyl-CoA hydratase/carnithine racemase